MLLCIITILRVSPLKAPRAQKQPPCFAVRRVAASWKGIQDSSDLPASRGSHLPANVPPSQLSVAALKVTPRPHSSPASSPGG